jgi:hypothetical protein
LTQFFDALKKLVVVFGVVMREGQALHAGHFRKLHGPIEAAVSPSAPFLQFLTGSTPDTSKHFQPFRTGLISMIVIERAFAFLLTPVYVFE